MDLVCVILHSICSLPNLPILLLYPLLPHLIHLPILIQRVYPDALFTLFGKLFQFCLLHLNNFYNTSFSSGFISCPFLILIEIIYFRHLSIFFCRKHFILLSFGFLAISWNSLLSWPYHKSRRHFLFNIAHYL